MTRVSSLRSGVALLAMFLAAGCERDEDQPRGFTFLVLSDTHVRVPGFPDDAVCDNQGNIDNLSYMVHRINTGLPDARFVIVTGDLVGCLFTDDPQAYLAGTVNPAETFKSLMDGLAVPWHVALGNHDYQKGFDVERGEGIMTEDIARIEAVWRAVLGVEPYDSFVHEGVRFILLNSNRGAARFARCPLNETETFCTGSFDGEQMDWLVGELNRAEPCLLFFHHPVITDHNDRVLWSVVGESFQVAAGELFYDIAYGYRDKIEAIFVGHGHMWARDVLFETIPVYETGALGDGRADRDNVHIVRADAGEGLLEVAIGNPAAWYMEVP